jgi:hypothetical protein
MKYKPEPFSKYVLPFAVAPALAIPSVSKLRGHAHRHITRHNDSIYDFGTVPPIPSPLVGCHCGGKLGAAFRGGRASGVRGLGNVRIRTCVM